MTNQLKHGFLRGTVTGSSLADCSDIAIRVAQQYFGVDAEVTVMLYDGELTNKVPNTDPSFRIPSFRVSFTAMLKGV